MGGPRIIVFHIRQLIRTGAFVLAGLVIIILLIWVLAPKKNPANLGLLQSESESLYIPGSYSSSIILNNQALCVTVTVDGDAITDISLDNVSSTHETLYPLIKPTMEIISRDVIRFQTTNVTYPNESRLTGQLLLEAINLALNQAYANVITTGFN